MGTTVGDVADHPSQEGQAPKAKQGRSTALLVFLVSLLLSCLLTARWGSWPLILVSDLLAAVSGISLGWIFVGGIPGRSKGTGRGGAWLRKLAADVSQTGTPSIPPGFGLGASFFAERAAPLRVKVRLLRSQAENIKLKMADQDTLSTATKQAVFDDKILEPEYAIGQGLISRDEYNQFRNTWLAQSELSLGLIIPLLLIVYAVSINLEIDSRGRLWMVAFIVFVTAFLFVIAMERRQKYRVELKLLLVGRWDKQAAADKAAKEAKAKVNHKTQEDTIRRILKEELKGLHLEVKPLVVEVRKSPEKAAETKETARGEPEEGAF